ncbi:hypothetical protein QYE76_058404 [Lolium multiflorum]|uniref:Wall-associated receptor kinase galacturonan-binding domain-containing protein n=1 Tax=Lolium multiflorum TaxID=4521 RepID=A0AAD8T710_LOLMU|nr:hypothetical protein QYE76_058404 [Lolium multiflorum]
MSAEALTVRPGCVDRCGNVDIPYPFGIGKDCFRGDGFEISCGKDSVPLLVGMNIRVLNLSLSPHPVARVVRPVAWQCSNSAGNTTSGPLLKDMITLNPTGVYRISRDLNELVVLGCNTLGLVTSGQLFMACLAFANDLSNLQDGACWGAGCCSIDLPLGLTNIMVAISSVSSTKLDDCPCNYAFIVDKSYYSFQKADLHMNGSQTSMPLSLDWAIRDNSNLSWTCADAATRPGFACKSVHSECVNSNNGPGYTCNCTKGYEGNAYVDNGCTVTGRLEIDQLNSMGLEIRRGSGQRPGAGTRGDAAVTEARGVRRQAGRQGRGRATGVGVSPCSDEAAKD